MTACTTIDTFERHEAALWRLRLGPGAYLTKRPADLAAIGPRLRHDPSFFALCLMRDPRDVIVSRHGQDRERYWSSLRTWKRRLPLVRAWAAHERFLLIRYEDLVREPEDTERRILRRMPFLESRRPFSEFPAVAAPSAKALEAMGPVRPFDAGSIGQWRKHLPRVAGQLAQHGPIADELIEFGYEPDSAWLSVLEGVTPDLTASHHGDRPYQRVRRTIEHAVLPWMSLMVLKAARAAGIIIA